MLEIGVCAGGGAPEGWVLEGGEAFCAEEDVVGWVGLGVLLLGLELDAV